MDMPKITRMDDTPDSIKKENLDLTDIIAETAADCEPMARSKETRIINDVMHPLPHTWQPYNTRIAS